ncbi:MAG: sugar transferase [Candidatus Hydrogenedentota bacterium]
MSIFRGHSVAYALFLLVADVVCVLLATLAAAFLTYSTLDYLTFTQYFFHVLLYSSAFFVAWVWVALSIGIFRDSQRDDLSFQIANIFKGVVISIGVSAVTAIYLSPRDPNPAVLTSFALFVFALLTGYRAALCLIIWGARQYGYNFRHVLLVGANERTVNLADTLVHHARFGYHIVGILEDDCERLALMGDRDIPHMGRFADLDKVLTENVVDELHICLPVRSYYETIQSMAHFSVSLGVTVRLVADLFPLRLATSRLHRIENIPMLSLSTVPEDTLRLTIKRVMDLVGSAILLIVLTPVFLATAIAIKLDSPGPAFFTQERVGKNQRRFKMIKFRSMVQNAEALRAELADLNEADGPVFKIKDDPRVTRVGRFIRKTSIDELPQLLNVFWGEMSLVGPRPLPPAEVEQQSWNQRRRLSVKPGMTGLWQVSGRSALSFKEWVNLDLNYIDNWSIRNDIVILFRTLYVVLRGRGAS